MNLWFRLIALLFKTWRSAPLRATTDVSRVHSRVWPNDLDISMHMNNGRYLTLMDLGRTDWTIRSGLLPMVVKRRWVPVALTITTRFVREMRLWTRFRLETRIIGWLETQMIFEHRFVLESGKRQGELAALAVVKAGIYDRSARRMVPIDELIELTGLEGERPDMREDVVAFLETEARMNTIGKSAPPRNDHAAT